MELRGADLDGERGEVVAGVGRERPLHEPEIAGADHADALGVPGLRADPPQRGEPVGALVEGAELALRAERAAHALHEHLQPALGEQPSEDQAEQLAAPVGRAHEHRRLRLVAARARDVAVGEQYRAVVHPHAQIALADDVAGLRARQAHAPGDDRAGEAHGGDRRPRRADAASGSVARATTRQRASVFVGTCRSAGSTNSTSSSRRWRRLYQLSMSPAGRAAAAPARTPAASEW